MKKLGEVSELWRYPVSSLRGERLDSATLDAAGIAGDRTHGLFDAATLSVANPDAEKRWRAAPQLEARTSHGAHEIRVPGGDWQVLESAAADEAASAMLGFPVTFRRFTDAVAGEEGAIAPRYQRGGLHVLTTASLRALRGRLPDTIAIDSRRFRPNLVIDTTADLDGFCDLGFVGRTLIVGEARASVTEPCARCSFVALAQDGLAFAPPVMHAIARHGGGGFGVLCEVEHPSQVSVGESVFLL